MRLQIDANKDKVEHRSELFRQKGEQRKIKELELQKGEVRRLELLAKIAEQVWCWCMYTMYVCVGYIHVLHCTVLHTIYEYTNYISLYLYVYTLSNYLTI